MSTGHVVLRALRLSDEDAVCSLLSDERVIRHMLFPRFDRTRAAEFTARFQTSEPNGFPPQAVLAIALAETKSLVGLCGLVLDADQRQGEAWYLLDPSLWGRGIVTSAVYALVTHGFTALRLHRIWAHCLPENPASSRVLEKVGFRHEGFHRQNLFIRDTWHDSNTYAILAADWSTRASMDRSGVEGLRGSH
ncbi:MAG: GNAT family N-acetyltransferase [Vicinamibacterales bacterium]